MSKQKEKKPIQDKKFFEIYKKEVLRWVKFFELSEFAVNFQSEDLGGASAQVIFNHADAWAVFKLNDQWNNEDGDWFELSEESVKKAAFHEVIHLLLSKFSSLAENRFITVGMLDVEEEKLTVKLSNIIYPKIKDCE